MEKNTALHTPHTHLDGNQSWIFIGRSDAKADTPILWPLDAKNWLIGKDPDAGEDWTQKKRMTEDEMVGWDEMVECPPTRWTWVWVISGSWWWTGKIGMLQSTGSQRAGQDWATEQQQNFLSSKKNQKERKTWVSNIFKVNLEMFLRFYLKTLHVKYVRDK